jgi:hypothetical protein
MVDITSPRASFRALFLRHVHGLVYETWQSVTLSIKKASSLLVPVILETVLSNFQLKPYSIQRKNPSDLFRHVCFTEEAESEGGAVSDSDSASRQKTKLIQLTVLCTLALI